MLIRNIKFIVIGGKFKSTSVTVNSRPVKMLILIINLPENVVSVAYPHLTIVKTELQLDTVFGVRGPESPKTKGGSIRAVIQSDLRKLTSIVASKILKAIITAMT